MQNLCVKLVIYKDQSRIAVNTQLYHTCKNSYMFRLYIFSHHQTGYSTLNKKNYKNTIELFSIGYPLGNVEEVPFAGGFERH